MNARSASAILAGVTLLLVVSWAPADAAKRGVRGTLTRVTWCADRMVACVDRANDGCQRQFGNDAPRELQCQKDSYSQCSRQWGDESDCQTRERPAPVANPRGTQSEVEAPPVRAPGRPNAPRPRSTEIQR